jgi:hypothetical protein
MPEFGTLFPFRYSAVAGHYRATHRFLLAATQAAGSRLFTLRNAAASDLIVITSCLVKILQTSAFTAAIEDSFDLTKQTAFSAIDTVNTVAPAGSSKQGIYGKAFPGDAVLTGVTVAGAAAGMTGGTMTPDASPISQLPIWFLAVVPTSAANPPVAQDDLIELADAAAPTVLQPNEGVALTNRLLLGAAAGASVYLDVSWTQVNK